MYVDKASELKAEYDKALQSDNAEDEDVSHCFRYCERCFFALLFSDLCWFCSESLLLLFLFRVMKVQRRKWKWMRRKLKWKRRKLK